MTVSVETGRTYEFGPFRLDAIRRRLWRDGQLVPVPPRSFDTLVALVEHAGRLIEKDELMRLVWGDTCVVEDNLIQQISTLRKLLGEHSDDPAYILTVPRHGYRFLAAVREVANGHGDNGTATPIVESPNGASSNGVPRACESPHPPTAIVRRQRAWTTWGVVAVIVGVAGAIGAVAVSRRPAESRRAMRFVVHPASDVTLLSGGVLSPDGGRLVYV